jgi:hypothetical protein
LEFWEIHCHANAGLQLRRAISIRPEGKELFENMLSRRQLQGFVGLPLRKRFS